MTVKTLLCQTMLYSLSEHRCMQKKSLGLNVGVSTNLTNEITARPGLSIQRCSMSSHPTSVKTTVTTNTTTAR